MDFIFIKSSKAGKEDYGSIYARVRTGKANMKVVTGFTIKQLEWEKYRSLQYTSSALMSSIGIKYGQFAQVLARIKAAFEADGFNPKEAKNIIESVKHDVLNGMMQIVEVKPKGRMLFEDFLTSYIEDMETGRRTKKGRTVKVSPAYHFTNSVTEFGRCYQSFFLLHQESVLVLDIQQCIHVLEP